MTTDTEALRAQFEHQCRELDLSRNEDGIYISDTTYIAWCYFQRGYAFAKAKITATEADTTNN